MGVALNYSSEEFRRRFCYDTVHAIHLTIYRLTKKKKRKPKEALLTVFYVKTKEKKKKQKTISFLNSFISRLPSGQLFIFQNWPHPALLLPFALLSSPNSTPSLNFLILFLPADTMKFFLK